MKSKVRRHGCLIRTLFAVLAGLSVSAFAAKEFVCTIREDGSGDYTTLGAWNDAIQCNLKSAGTLTAGWENLVGDLIADDTVVTWDGGAGSGRLVHMTTLTRSGKNAFMIKNASGSPLAQGHVVSDGANSFTVADAPDSVIAVARIEGKWNNPEVRTTMLSFATHLAWATSETNYIHVYTVGEARHRGKWTETAHRLVQTTSGSAVWVRAPWSVFDGLQIMHDLTPGETGRIAGFHYNSADSANAGEDGKIWLKNSIITATTSITNITSTANRGIYGQSNLPTNLVVNCIVYHPVPPGNTSQHRGINGGANLRVYNSTISGFGASTFGIGVIFNTATPNSGSISAGTISHCASSAGTGDNAVHWTKGAADWNNVFEDWANGDFRLRNYTGTGAIIDKGMTDPASGLYSDDIVGNQRGEAWDIGAFEWVEPPPKGTLMMIR